MIVHRYPRPPAPCPLPAAAMAWVIALLASPHACDTAKSMSVRIRPAPPVPAIVVDMMKASVAGGLHGATMPRPAALPAANDVDWSALAALAWNNKMLILVQRGLDRLGIDQPDVFRDTVRMFRETTLKANARNLETIRHLMPPLLDAGLTVVVFKGPVQQRMLHGDYFVRPASDIDILTADGEFDRAAAILRGIGYEMAAQCDTPWWRHFLGEQQFLTPDGSRTVVDLHHRVQQPGCPAPRHLDDYLVHAARVPFGQLMLPTLSLESIALLASISFVKAIVHREPAGSYVVDLLAALAVMDERARQHLFATARHQGLFNTLQTAVHAAERLFGPVAGPGLTRRTRPSCLDADLDAIVLSPWCEGIAWPKRRQMLWELCDSSGLAGKPGTFALESARALTGEICRLYYEPRHTADCREPLAA